jgi:hypothetical protein
MLASLYAVVLSTAVHLFRKRRIQNLHPAGRIEFQSCLQYGIRSKRMSIWATTADHPGLAQRMLALRLKGGRESEPRPLVLTMLPKATSRVGAAPEATLCASCGPGATEAPIARCRFACNWQERAFGRPLLQFLLLSAVARLQLDRLHLVDARGFPCSSVPATPDCPFFAMASQYTQQPSRLVCSCRRSACMIDRNVTCLSTFVETGHMYFAAGVRARLSC